MPSTHEMENYLLGDGYTTRPFPEKNAISYNVCPRHCTRQARKPSSRNQNAVATARRMKGGRIISARTMHAAKQTSVHL